MCLNEAFFGGCLGRIDDSSIIIMGGGDIDVGVGVGAGGSGSPSGKKPLDIWRTRFFQAYLSKMFKSM
jgi:hypothetical protein